MNSHEAQIGRNWTLISFQYTGKTNDTSPLAVFDSPQNGLRVMHPLDANGGLAAERVYLYAMPGQSYLRTLPIGSVQLLHSNQSINADGNRLIWPNDELNSRVLALFEDKPAGFSIVYDTPKVRVLRVIG